MSATCNGLHCHFADVVTGEEGFWRDFGLHLFTITMSAAYQRLAVRSTLEAALDVSADPVWPALRSQAEHAASPAFSPLVPRSALSPLALVLLVAAFILTFAFTTYAGSELAGEESCAGLTRYPSSRVGTTSPRRRRAGAKAAPPPAQSTLGQELLLGSTASVAGGIGLVLAFCAIGANV